MAKTFRKRGYIPDWLFTEHSYWWEDGSYVRHTTIVVGAERKKRLARFHSDVGTGPNWMRDEPRWWRNLYERKDRRMTDRLLHKFIQDQEFEVILRKKPRKDYWW